MSRERDFHKIIEAQYSEEKSRFWNKLEPRLDEEEIELGEVLRKKHFLSKKNIIIISSLAALFLAVAIILICNFTSKKDDPFRYCITGDYYSIETETSIDQYSKENNLDLKYFNWYLDSEFYLDQQYKLNSTNEVICLREELLDKNGVYIIQYITKHNIKIDFLEFYTNTCSKSYSIVSVNIKYGITNGSTYAFFNYKGYNYYLTLEETSDEQYILSIIETLFN